ncbi:RHS repeat domain-containing protein [Phragmitibacter flavus]|nr:RHS repeat-associated core domain-containing protein [Phragmitibacter flavus]
MPEDPVVPPLPPEKPNEPEDLPPLPFQPRPRGREEPQTPPWEAPQAERPKAPKQPKDPNQPDLDPNKSDPTNPSPEASEPTQPGNAGSPPGTSGCPVRYSSGQLQFEETDLSLKTFGLNWGHSRSYANRLNTNAVGLNGSSWLVGQSTSLFFDSTQSGGGPAKICMVSSGNNNLWTTRQPNGSYKSTFVVNQNINHDTQQGEYVWKSTKGTRLSFYDQSSSHPSALQGKLKAVVMKSGAHVAISYDSAHRPSHVDRTHGSQNSRFGYQYFAPNADFQGYLSGVNFEIDQVPVQRASYGYHSGSTGGSYGDLRTVVTENFDVATNSWKAINHKHYRYYTSNGGTGFTHGLKYVIRDTAYQRMVNAGHQPETAPEEVLAEFADFYFEYDSLQRVSLERLRGGTQEFTFQYGSNPVQPSLDDVNIWNTRTVENLPDGSQNRVYTNKAGKVILHVHEDLVTSRKWYQYTQYNSQFQAILQASPAAIASVTEPTPGSPSTLTVTLKADAGLIHEYSYYTSTNPTTGAVADQLEKFSVKEGSSGLASSLRSWEYDVHQAFGDEIYPIRAVTHYPEAHNSTIGYRTSFAYSWYTDGNANATFQVREKISTMPVVSPTQRGTGVADVLRQQYSESGLATWAMNARGVIFYRAYDPANSAVTQWIQDVDTSQMSGVPAGWSTLSGFGKHLVTDFINDNIGRTLRVVRPSVDVDPGSVGETGVSAIAVRPVYYYDYRDSTAQVWSAVGWLTGTLEAPSWHLFGPVLLRLTDQNDRVLDEIRATPLVVDQPLSPDTFQSNGALPSQELWVSWTDYERDAWGRVVQARVFHDIPLSGSGVEGQHYDAVRFYYDLQGRLRKQVSPGGTITRTVVDTRGLPTATWVGTNDAGATDNDPSGGEASGNNMKMVWRGIFDNGNDGGNGNLTESMQVLNDTPAGGVTQFSYDYRNRTVQQNTSDGFRVFFQTTLYDNLGRPLTSSRYHTSVTIANRTHEETVAYDSLGRAYEGKVFVVNPNGTLGSPLVSGVWYDPSGNVIKQIAKGSKAVVKNVFDSLDRTVVSYLVAEDASSAPDNTNNVSLDVVIQQDEFVYNDCGDTLAAVNRSRFDDATGTGHLQGPSGSEPKSRDNYTFLYPDPSGRLCWQAQLGTHGGTVPTRPGVHPPSSDTTLVTEWQYAADSAVAKIIDPKGVDTTVLRDAAGRRIQQTDNAAGSTTGQQTSQYEYAPDGGLSILRVLNATTGNQVTTWTYGTNPATSKVARTDLPVSKTSPTGKVYSQTYNRQGVVESTTDPNGTFHLYIYDLMGRLIQNHTPVIGSGVDGSVRLLGTEYDTHGRAFRLTSYSATSAIVNQVVRGFNGIGCLTTEYQSHGGAVTVSTPRVQYQCTSATDNIQRRTSITYPNGRQLDYEYGSSGGIDDVLNRVQSVHDDDLTVLAEYQHVGLGLPSITTLPQPGIEQRWKKLAGDPNGDGGDPYTGYDRFTRVIRSHWLKPATTPVSLVDAQWGYDRASLKTWRKDALAPSGSEQDQYFSYDNRYQVTQRQRGILDTGHTGISGTPAQQENFGYDPAGNWTGYQQTNAGTLDINQSRAHNASNQITSINSVSSDVSYDDNGNMLEVPTGGQALDGPPRKLVWDAWNRLRKVYDDEDNLIAEYQYDGQMRRVTSAADSTVRHFYYDDQWRSVEERLDSISDAVTNHVWQPGNRWELILRDRSTANDGTFDERLYSLKDELDPVALIDTNGSVVERCAFSAFGKASFFDATYTSRTSSSYGWNFLFHGEFADAETSWMNYGFRYYSTDLGRWLNEDPIGLLGGLNSYSFAGSSPMRSIDVLGLCDEQNGGSEVWDAISEWMQVGGTQTDARGVERPVAGAGYPSATGRGYVDAFGSWHESFCMSCHGTTSTAQFNREQAALANATSWGAYLTAESLNILSAAVMGGGLSRAFAAKSGPVVYRQLSAADRIALDAGQPLMPKGTGGTILDHIRSQPTGHISVSETAAATARFNGGNGLVEINVNAATAGGARFIPHSEVLQGVGARANQIRNVREAQEALFQGPIPASAVRLIE